METGTCTIGGGKCLTSHASCLEFHIERSTTMPTGGAMHAERADFFSVQRAKYTPLGQSPDLPMALHRLYNGTIMSMFHPFLKGSD